MGWTLDAVPGVRRDLVSIARFIRQSSIAKREPPSRAIAMADRRLEKIGADAIALTHAPYQGTRCPELGQNTRRVTKDRATFYFDLNEDRQIIRLLAIFYGGQDHDPRILARLLTPEP